ncbi:MAG: axoneme-associated protein mst101 [Parcubacteria group bacterium Gr01-1014_49]|nr:MAG: axoneme-associated protein mst101 [Parcubacteria group bacterium Gr01-1014_49]
MRLLRTIGIIGSVAALLLSAGIAFAEESTANTDAVVPVAASRPAVAPIRVEVKKAAQERAEDLRKEAQKRVETAREEAKTLLETKREEAKAVMETKREEAKKLMETKREEAKALMEKKREEAKTLMETKREEAKSLMEAKREKAEKRLSDIKDKAKQEVAQRLAKQLEELNSRWTDRFMDTLDRYVSVLQKIQNRADIAADAGKDVVATTAAIQSANTAIETARASVIAQAAKTYVLDTAAITTTTATTTDKGQSELMKNLKTAFQNIHKTLFKDLYALRDGQMTDARKAVQSALQTLGKIPGVNEGSSATSTAATSN